MTTVFKSAWEKSKIPLVLLHVMVAMYRKASRYHSSHASAVAAECNANTLSDIHFLAFSGQSRVPVVRRPGSTFSLRFP